MANEQELIFYYLVFCLSGLLATFMFFILCSYVFLSLPSIRMYICYSVLMSNLLPLKNLSFLVACNLYVFLFYVLMSFCPYQAPTSKSVFRFLCQIYCHLRICLFWLLATFMFFILCSYVFLSLPSIRMYICYSVLMSLN